MKIDAQTRRWWTGLRLISCLNLALWGGLFFTGAATPTQLTLSGIYVAVCAFRSFLPRIGLERVVLVDHWLSSIFLGRSLATVAEMAFTAQLAILLVALAPLSSDPALIGQISELLLPLIAVAQLTCWFGVLSGEPRWHALEEALWVVMLLLLMGAGWLLWSADGGALQPLIVLSWLSCLGGIYVMAGLDIPMYLRRSAALEPSARRSLAVGLRGALTERHQEGSWSFWRAEALWITPYFSLAVWMSLALALWTPVRVAAVALGG